MLFLVYLSKLAGRGAARMMLVPIVGYYLLTRSRVRRDCRAYLRRVGSEPSWRNVYRQLLRFAQVSLDRLFLLSGKMELFELEVTGHHQLVAARASGRGALMLGAHLGSFEALRAFATKVEMPIHVLADFGNAELINGVLDATGRNRSVHFIPYRDNSLDHLLEIRSCVERGEFVALLADRGSGTRAVELPFLGTPAPFPTGPFELAALLGCPVYLTLALHTSPNRYHLLCEPLSESVQASRRDPSSLTPYVLRYAQRLEHHVRSHPDNWFNFYDFWNERTDR